MNPTQENTLKELIEAYFKGGNSAGDGSAGMLKSKLDAIRDFVKENFT